MSDSFEIPVFYKNQELLFTAHMRPYGFVQRIEIELGDCLVFVEWDEERNLRVLVDPDAAPSAPPDAGLLQAIVDVLEEARK
jgi:hypothetical protein